MVWEILSNKNNLAFVSIGFLGLAILVFIFIMIKLYFERRSNALVKGLITGALIILTGYLISLILLVIGELYWLGIMPESNFYLMVSLNFYYGGWALGLRKFMKETFRTPKDRKKKYFIFINSIISVILLALIITIITKKIVMESGENNPIAIFLFLVQGVIGVIVFIIFQKLIRGEIDKNISKLMKARLELLRRIIIIQLIMFVVIVLGDAFQLISPAFILPGEVATISILALFSIWTGLLLGNMINLPSPIRRKFGLTRTSFETVRKMILED